MLYSHSRTKIFGLLLGFGDGQYIIKTNVFWEEPELTKQEKKNLKNYAKRDTTIQFISGKP